MDHTQSGQIRPPETGTLRVGILNDPRAAKVLSTIATMIVARGICGYIEGWASVLPVVAAITGGMAPAADAEVRAFFRGVFWDRHFREGDQ